MHVTLDWRPKWDERNRLYAIDLLNCYTWNLFRKSTQRQKFVFLDQGSEGACTGFAFEHVRALTPKQRSVSNATAKALYYEARRQDEWEGEDYDGSSVNGAMKAGRFLGLINSWRWATTINEIKHGLCYHGAFEIGVWWYTGMFYPNSQGIVYPTGQKEGGHAIALSGYKDYQGTKLYRLDNSWGAEWGDRGGCWIHEEDLVRLMSEQGEFAIPAKV